MIRERVNSGFARARANGKKPGRPGAGAEVEKKIRFVLGRGDRGIRKIGRELGVRASVVQRFLAGELIR